MSRGKDKPFAMEVMSKYLLSTDKEILEGPNDISVTKYRKRVPYPTPEAFGSVIKELAQVHPKAKGQDPARFDDDSIVRELDKSGFI